MTYMVLWFISLSMTAAFLDVGYLHKTPGEALILSLAVGAAVTAMEFLVLARLRRRLGWRS